MRGRNLRLLALLLALGPVPAAAQDVRVKELGRFMGWRDNALVGYGIVTGLSGSGDSPRSQVTRQAMKNVLSRLGANVTPEQVQSRNVAAVIVTAKLPPSANVGDTIDVTVSSIGDARSLVGGTLLMTPLMGPDQKSYALAQGAVVVGGYGFESDYNVRQKNYPTSGQLPGGATVETSVSADLLAGRGELTFVLKDPDATAAERVAEGINSALGPGAARVRDPGAVTINAAAAGGDVNGLMARVENVRVMPVEHARIVINERSGTVVAGGAVQISSVVISQGDIKVSVSVDNEASQPIYTGGYAPGVRSLVVANTKLEVSDARDAVARFPSTTVAELIQGLQQVRVNTRGIIAILQAMKAAGAVHAEIIVQ